MPVVFPIPQDRPAGRTRYALLGRTAAAALVAGAMLGGGLVLPLPQAHAQTAIQPSGLPQKLPDFVGLVKEVKPAVVSITSIIKDDGSDDEDDNGQGGGQGGGQGNNEGGLGGGQGGQGMPFPFPFPFQMSPQGRAPRTIEARGSGFVISADGFIVTNNHVVKGATSVSITFDDGTTLKAKVIGRDAGTDIALLKVKPSAKLSFIQLGDSDAVEPGQWVVAVGNPYGLGGSVTAGIVSARGRDIGDGPYDSFIQIDAPINRGNSGGPLFTQDGKVIGVNTAIFSPSGGSIGIGFAIPSDTVKSVVSQLQRTGHVVRGYLGVTAQAITPTMAKALNLPGGGTGGPDSGALVASVQPDSPAEKAGLKSGDVITTLNGQKVGNPRDLALKVSSVNPGGKVTIAFLRNGTTQTAEAAVANLATHQSGSNGPGGGGNASGGSIGVALGPLTADVRQQLSVDDGVHGAVVRSVKPGSVADQAGIQAGDILVGVGNKNVANPKDAVDAVHAALRKGDVALRILRNNQMLFVAISPDNGSANNGNDNEDNDNGSSGGGDQPG